MGSNPFESTRATHIKKDKMPSTTTTYTNKSETSTNRSFRARSEFEMTVDALDVDRRRFKREFLTPEPVKFTSNYYPRHKQTGLSPTGSPFVSYYARPYFNYKLASRYGC